MAWSCFKFTAALCIGAVLLQLCLLESAEGGMPTCLNETRIEHTRMAKPCTITVSDKKTAPHNKVRCYRGDWCCFSCSYNASNEVQGFYLKMENKDERVFNCDGKQPLPDKSNYKFDEEQQKLCLKGLVHDSGRYQCKMRYEDPCLRSTLTDTDVTMADKLGIPTVTVENKDPLKEGERATITCNLDTKYPTLINATWYNGTKIFDPENVSRSIDGNRITFWMEHPVTIFDNGKEISCHVTDGVQTKMSAKVPLDVQYAPRVECSITAPLVVGHPAIVNCTINANPEVTPNSTVFPDELFDIGWVQNGSSISTSHLQSPCNKTLTIAATNNLGTGEAPLLMDCLSCPSTSGRSNSSSGQGVPVGTVVVLVVLFSVVFLLLGICLERHNCIRTTWEWL